MNLALDRCFSNYWTMISVDDNKACISGAVASCQNATWVVGQGSCSKSQACFALPSTREAGTLVTCTLEKSAVSAIQATGATGGIFGNSTTTNTTSSPTNTPATEDACDSEGDDDNVDESGDSDCTDGADITSAFSSLPTPSPSLTASSKPIASSPASTNLPTITLTKTVTKAKSTSATPTPTSPGTVTLTLTVGDQPTALAPVTRTLSPQKASSLLSRLMANGATVISSSSSVPSMTPSGSSG
ncbi:hypothetical protein DXG01_001828 [Tephrocybe rancida]|nr:hypothetical protein DXG01_001828 [Tephrocybe rancida]